MNGRRRRHWPAVVSLLLLAGVVALWVRSRHWLDAAVVFLPGEGKAQVAASFRGKLHLILTRLPFGPDRSATATVGSEPAEQAAEKLQQFADEPKVDHGRWGFRFARGENALSMPDARGRYVLLSLPHWAFVALFSIVPVISGAGLVRHWRWKRGGRCLNCGYDLRGTDGAVCPECGADKPGGAAVSAAPSRPASGPA